MGSNSSVASKKITLFRNKVIATYVTKIFFGELVLGQKDWWLK